MMKNNLMILLAIFIASVVLFACEKEYINKSIEISTVKDKNSNAGMDTVYFSKDIKPILDAKCKACHGSNQNPNLQSNPYQNIISGGYVNTANPEASSIYKKLTETTSTHAGRSTSDEQDRLLEWIKQGALNN